MNNRHLCALCLVWLFSLELRWCQSRGSPYCTTAPAITQTVMVSICGACGCAIHSSSPPPRPPDQVKEWWNPSCHGDRWGVDKESFYRPRL